MKQIKIYVIASGGKKQWMYVDPMSKWPEDAPKLEIAIVWRKYFSAIYVFGLDFRPWPSSQFKIVSTMGVMGSKLSEIFVTQTVL